MFKKMKNSNMYSILILVALLVFCCIFGLQNQLYTEGLTGSTSTGLTDFIYHSGAAHNLPPPAPKPKAVAPMTNCQSPYFSEPKQCPDKNFLFWKFPTHVEQGATDHGVLGSLKDAGGNCSKICSADKNCSAWLINPADGHCWTFPAFNKGDTAEFSCKNNVGKWQGCVKADVKSQGVNFIDVTSKPSPPPSLPPAPAPPPLSGKCVPNVPALLVANNSALNNISAVECPQKTRQEDCGALPAFPQFGTPPCPLCCQWQPV